MAMIPFHTPDPAWFAAIGIVAMWVQNRTDVELRRAIALLAMAPAAGTVGELFRRLALEVGATDLDVRRLARVVVEHAQRRALGLFGQAEGTRAIEGVRLTAQDAAKAFAIGRTEALGHSWPVPTSGRATHRWTHDEPYVVSAFSGLFNAVPPPRRDEWLLAQVGALQALVLVRLEPRQGDASALRSGSSPYASDREVLALVASAVVEAREPERRRAFWMPWLRLAGEHHYWSEEFLEAAFRAALDANEDPENAMAALREIIEDGLSILETAARISEIPLRDFGALIGMERYGQPLTRWTDARRPTANGLVDLWERWARICVPRQWDLEAFLRLAATPAAAEVRLRLMTSFADSLPDHVRLNQRQQDALVGFLAVSWSECAAVLGPGPQRHVFDQLLRRLVTARNREAMALLDTIARGA